MLPSLFKASYLNVTSMLIDFSKNVRYSVRNITHFIAGVEGVYNSQLGRADIVRVTNISGPLPNGLCFQLVDQGFEPLADAADAAGQDCVNVGQYLVWPQGKYWTQMALVAYGNNVFSATSKMTGMEAGNDQGRREVTLKATKTFILSYFYCKV